jgi:hypothetical protein
MRRAKGQSTIRRIARSGAVTRQLIDERSACTSCSAADERACADVADRAGQPERRAPPHSVTVDCSCIAPLAASSAAPRRPGAERPGAASIRDWSPDSPSVTPPNTAVVRSGPPARHRGLVTSAVRYSLRSAATERRQACRTHSVRSVPSPESLKPWPWCRRSGFKDSPASVLSVAGAVGHPPPRSLDGA